MFNSNPMARLGLTAAFGLAAAGVAQAEMALSAEALNQLAPSAAKSYVERQIARQQGAPAQGGDDQTPPVLTLFNAGTGLNLGKAAAPFKIGIKGTDDLSGIKSVGYQATGPSGQVISGAIDTAFPAASYSGSGGLAGASQFLQPGAWKFTYAFSYDWAGNFLSLNEAQLAALGNTSITVSNSGGYDLVKPVLVSGSSVITPLVSLSAVAKGTAAEDPLVGLNVKTRDAGNTAVAGVKSVSAIMCQLADPSRCIYPMGFTSATGLTAATIAIKTQVSATRGNVPGDYTLQSVTVMDHAGNFTTLNSTLFGGSTDFSTLFSATVIKLKP
jgi:hypothetical protein